MTSLPDWLVERAALDEVGSVSRDRLDRADPRELADRITQLREHHAAELTAYPADPAIAQIEARVATARQRMRRRRRGRLAVLGLATSAAALLITARFVGDRGAAARPQTEQAETTRVKGSARLLAFRYAGDHAERLESDALVHPGDVIQLRYNAGGRGYGVIASVDGAGAVTLHFPSSEDAKPEAMALAAETTTLPTAFALDDAPRFERFFFITANKPLDLQQTLGALRTLAHRDDSATAALELPPHLRQWSLRLRKPTKETSP